MYLDIDWVNSTWSDLEMSACQWKRLNPFLAPKFIFVSLCVSLSVCTLVCIHTYIYMYMCVCQNICRHTTLVAENVMYSGIWCSPVWTDFDAAISMYATYEAYFLPALASLLFKCFNSNSSPCQKNLCN